MFDFLTYVFHGGALDGKKKFVGIAMHLVSKIIKPRYPEVSSTIDELADYVMTWGVASDAAKGMDNKKAT